ncbi:NtaA/DmoA family FMN-dependent monooxygenase [Parafrankia sp. EUN1f]|uniref:NtaA/DmoA family FMN-dependent monooxygenase n=1 Tax=Parafrankia sp. EUN1f TaxID=102897 RepID=UPI0001C44AFD|nr:NtaA/DmoA family FMN-dependent monooxygenase [Parafrankia sp. EUN1f]EFC82937.1 putative luciferase-like monooxygenase [Parafrankia sp. EUN1f]
MFHLGLFTGCGVQSWKDMWSGEGATDWMSPQLYIDVARAVERAGFDCIILEDAHFVPDVFRGNTDFALKNGFHAPKMDLFVMTPFMLTATKHLGILPTLTTTFHPPYMAARTLATLDHLSGGRGGANLVMSHNDRTAQNYGLDGQADHDLRYDQGDEWVQLVTELWNSWDADALTVDRDNGVYVDPAKVHEIHFSGRFYRSRGPLNSLRPPQGRPVFSQAGGSGRGKDFAARNVDLVMTNVTGIDTMKAFRDDLVARLEAFDRKPDSCKVMFNVAPVLGETQREAEEKRAAAVAAREANIESNLGWMSYYSGIDFGKFDLDAPMPRMHTNASRSTTQNLQAKSTGLTLREFASYPSGGAVELVGTPDAVAAQMGEVMDEVGGDGFLIQQPMFRRAISEITDGLAPALRRRGLIRDGYSYPHFRDNLLEF